MGPRRQPIPYRHALTLIALVTLIGLTGCVGLGGRPATDALSPRERLKLGVSYEHAGKLDLALREYQRGAVGRWRGTALTCQGNIHAAQGQVAAAETAYRAALALQPDRPDTLNNLAWLLHEQSQPGDEAERLIRQAIALDNGSSETYQDTLTAILAAR